MFAPKPRIEAVPPGGHRPVAQQLADQPELHLGAQSL